MMTKLIVPGPHNGATLLVAGTPLADARRALVLVHGRGADAEGMLDLAANFRAERLAWVAPQANGHTWYPYSFLTPVDRNQPHLDSALAVLEAITTQLVADGISRERQVLLGFSQGACLVLEFAARSGVRWGGVAGLSGGVIGPPGAVWDRPAGIAKTPIFLGCSDVDPHIPVERVHESRDLFTRLGAVVDERIYPGMPHTINEDEVQAVSSLLAAVPR
jgi:predicted esterase